MIRVRFTPETLDLSIRGHANTAPKGQDIVCAAASILFYTLAQAVQDSTDMLEDYSITDVDGKGRVSCKPKEGALSTMQRTYWTVLEGFELLEAQFPTCIKFFCSGLENTKTNM